MESIHSWKRSEVHIFRCNMPVRAHVSKEFLEAHGAWPGMTVKPCGFELSCTHVVFMVLLLILPPTSHSSFVKSEKDISVWPDYRQQPTRDPTRALLKMKLRALSATATVGLVTEVVGSTTAAIVGTRLAGILRTRGRVDRSGAGAGRRLRGALTLTVVVLVLEATTAATRARWDIGLRGIVVHAFPTRGTSLTSIST